MTEICCCPPCPSCGEPHCVCEDEFDEQVEPLIVTIDPGELL